MLLHTCLELSRSRPNAIIPPLEIIGANVPKTGVGSAYNIPCVSVIIYLIPYFLRYLSDSGTYPHSGSQIPFGFLPRYFLYVSTPTFI